MGDSELVTKFECVTMHRQQDQKINDEVEKIRKDFDDKLDKVYEKIDSLIKIGIGILITSLVSIILFLATTVFAHVQFG
jgi:tetrahydromethanopterin S-methyltransferase subunit G